MNRKLTKQLGLPKNDKMVAKRKAKYIAKPKHGNARYVTKPV